MAPYRRTVTDVVAGRSFSVRDLPCFHLNVDAVGSVSANLNSVNVA
jgi:hypothetical protein